jgi:signal transduction histidine kinase/ActR/RegA family two-component response regulator
MTVLHTNGLADEARRVRGWPLEVGLAVIPSEEQSTAPISLPEVPFGLALIEPISGLILGANHEAELLLGLPAGELVSFRDLVAGDGGDLLRGLERIGAEETVRFAFRRHGPGGTGTLIHGWGRRVEVDRRMVVYCTFLRPDSDLGTAEPERSNGHALDEVVAEMEQLRESEARARNRASELEEAAVRLSNADRRKDEFIARLAHELRNPLAPICIWTQRLLESDETPPLVRHASQVVNRQSRHLTRLVEDLLELSRFVWGKVALRRDLVRLGEPIELAMQMAQPLIEERRHHLDVTISPTPIWVRGDVVRLTEIFHNLLDNAAKYTPPGGKIELNLIEQGGEAVVQVKDTGIGIDADFMPRIFDLFSRSPNNETSQSGLGLGLSLVHQMVRAHEGTVTAWSPGPGQGSRFEVRLPLVEPPAHPPRPSSIAPAVKVSPQKILVVDDNRDGAEAIALYLEDLGHEVAVAADGATGLALAERLRPQLVLLDIGLPGMDGYEVARRLRAEPWSQNVVMLAISGYDSEEDRQRSLAAGCDEHLVKPVEPQSIVRFLASHGRRDQG